MSEACATCKLSAALMQKATSALRESRETAGRLEADLQAARRQIAELEGLLKEYREDAGV